ncbi:MAG TPA: Rieske (2Fe-2S) protein [Terracidiphilus sp.]|nr:Rieske (2Fe-2S) protein [Terracidiphilus sp.]
MSDAADSQHFASPYIMEEPGEQRSRRAFLIAAGAAGVAYTAALAYPIYRYLASPAEMAQEASAVTEITLKDAQKLPAGSVLMFKFGTRPAMLIHHTNGQWISMTAVCTHLGCTVSYQPGPDRIHCSCHGGVYNAYTGANVSGPPPKPLKLFKVTVNDSGVEVSRV